MKKIKEWFDPQYAKICIYGCLTVIITAIILVLLYTTSDFWVWLLSLLSAVLKPIILGGVFCYLLSPLVTKLENAFSGDKQRKWARPAAVTVCYLLILLALIILIALIILTMYKSFSAISIEGIQKMLDGIKGEWAGFKKMIEERLAKSGISLGKIGGMFGSFVSGLTSTATGLVFGIIFSVYFLLDGQSIAQYWKRVLLLMVGKTQSKGLQRFLADADKVFSGYIRGQFVDALIVGVITSVVLLILGVPSAIIVGILTGLGNLIPYAGPFVGYVVLILVCIPTGAWFKLLLGAIALFVIMQVDGNIINPKLLSDNVQVHPLLVVAALIGGGTIGGLVGMLVSVPVAALLKLQFDRYLDKKESQKEQG